MTDQHPITPPPELWKQFAAGAYTWKEAVTYAYRAGADQELEACCEWLEQNCGRWELPAALRAARRPKPPSLKEQALKELKDWTDEKHGPGGEVFLCDGLSVSIIRRALEQLDD